MTDAFTEIGNNFQSANPNVTVAFNFAGSQALRTQIEKGAPADVFASTNGKEMETLIANSFIAENASQIFLSNKLVLILPADNPASINSIEDLAASGIKIVLAAEEVPVGNYARQALNLMNISFGEDFKDKVLANVVSSEDNVKQVVAQVQLGEADAGIVYTSDAVAAPLYIRSARVGFIGIDKQLEEAANLEGANRWQFDVATYAKNFIKWRNPHMDSRFGRIWSDNSICGEFRRRNLNDADGNLFRL